MTTRSPAAPPQAAELRRGNDAVRTVVLPGAPIESLVVGARDWCAAGPWREHAPTIAASVLPTYVAGVPGVSLPDGGVLGTVAPLVDVRAGADPGSITAQWDDAHYPLRVQRVLRWDPDGALRATYDMAMTQTAAVPFVWGLTMPVAWTADARLELPAGARARVAASWGQGLPAAGSEFVWPSLRDGGRLVDLSQPTTMPRGSGVLCFVELPRGKFTLRAAGGALDVAGTPGVVTHARVLIEHDAPLPGRTPTRWWQRRSVARQIVVGPTVGAPDALHEAVGGWKTARWLERGASLTWDLTIRSTSLD